MKKDPQTIDSKIRARLKTYSSVDNDHWSFCQNDKREHMHGCVQYPAMMVPQMQSELVNVVVEAIPKVKRIYEPFVGSGTVMIEAMKRGFDFWGQDINPLAVLLCRAKSGPFYHEALSVKIEELLGNIRADRKNSIEARFKGLDKWFNSEVADQLSKIRRAMRKENCLWCRRFFWMTMAETVRLTSNSRTTTYKLHIRTQEDLKERRVSPIQLFKTLLYNNLEKFCAQKNVLLENGYLLRGRYIGEINIDLNDSSTTNTCLINNTKCDLLVTSPPYGDNRTTVSYGQYSFLPLQWIDLEDIDSGLTEARLVSAYEIDRLSLGGTLSKAAEQVTDLLDVSVNLRRTLRHLKGLPGDGALRVVAFWRDLNRCLKPTLAALKTDGYMVWTVGNRKVSGRQVPMDKILSELLIAHGAILVERFQRTIPSKRMARRNSISNTMSKEIVLIMRKGSR